MKAQTKALVASLIVVALGLSAVSGITYSWFSDSQETQVSITTAKFDLNVEKPQFQVKSGSGAWSEVYSLNSENAIVNSENTVIDSEGVIIDSSFAVVNVNPVDSKYNVSINGAAHGDSVKLIFPEISIQNTIAAYYYEDAVYDSTRVNISGIETDLKYIERSTSDSYKVLYGTGGSFDTNEKEIIITVSDTASQNSSIEASFSFNAIQFNAPIDTTSRTSSVMAGMNVIAIDTSSTGNSKSVAIAFDGSSLNGDVTVTEASTSDSGYVASAGTFLTGVSVTSEIDFEGTPVTLTFVVEGDCTGSDLKIYHNGELFDANESGESITYYYNSDANLTTITVVTKQGFSSYFVVVPGVAKIGDDYYSTLEDAFDAAMSSSTSETIDVLASSQGGGVVVADGNDIVVNFNGFTYEIINPTVGSSGTETNGFQVKKDSKVTFNDGIIKSSTAKTLVQNYADLTLNNMVLDGSDLLEHETNYTLGGNNGKIIIKDSTIIAKTGKYAFDVCAFGSYVGPSVDVVGNSVIDGSVELNVYNVGPTVQNLTIGPSVSWESLDINGVIENGDPKKVFVKIETSLEGKVVRYNGSNCLGINTVEGLLGFKEKVESQKTDYVGNVVLLNDVNLDGLKWEPIGKFGVEAGGPYVYFAGLFDGMNNSILNLKVEGSKDPTEKDTGAGLFSNLCGSVKNLTIRNATITNYSEFETVGGVGVLAGSICYDRGPAMKVISNVHVGGSVELEGLKNVGAIIGFIGTTNATITNCSVGEDGINGIVLKVSARDNEGSFDGGDKVGGIVGNIQPNNNKDNTQRSLVEKCNVFGVTIIGYRDLGGVVGINNIGECIVKECSVSDVSIKIDKIHDYKEYGDEQSKYNANSIVGRGVDGSGSTGAATIEFC